MSEGLFRQAAIDKVSSPEELDRLMRVTSPMGWLALLTVALLVFAVAVWSVAGSVPDLVDGRGTLFRGERLHDIKATMSGIVTTLTIKPGNRVEAGQTIATLKREYAATEQRDADAVTIEKDKAMVRRLRGQLKILQRQWQLQTLLVEQAIGTPKVVLEIERDMDGLRGQIDSLTAEVDRIALDAHSTAEVKSAEAGLVVEVIKSVGDRVREDEPLVRLEPAGREAEAEICGGHVHALLYVPTSSAGKIRKGQFARVSPSDVKKEEYGFIFGTVESIASHPASTADMTEKLKNDQLVKEFMSGGPVFEARVCLETDAKNAVNPFKWSSHGPPTRTEAGTVCAASVVVDERKPYTYVVPAVRRTVGF